MPIAYTNDTAPALLEQLQQRIADLEAENSALRQTANNHTLAATLRMVQAELQAGESLFRQIVDALPDGYMLFTHPDEHGHMRLIDCNIALCRSHQLSREELIGIRSGSLAEDPLSNEERLAQSIRLRNGERIVNESTQRRKDGSTFRVEVASINVRLGEQDLILGIARDITQHKQIETELRELNSQLEQRVIERTEALLEVKLHQERLVASGRMAAIVAHEVNTPLQVIQNLLYLVENGVPESRERYIRLLQDEIRRVSTIMRRLLELNEAGSGVWGEVKINDVIERVLLLTELLLKSHHIRVSCELTDNLPAIWASSDALCQVLINLIINAVDAMEQGGTLTIRSLTKTVSETSYIVVETTDTGKGIDIAYVNTIFQPFFTTKSTGQGIGLSISQRIIEEHKGTIQVQSSPGHGSTFSLNLPILATSVPDLPTYIN
jgi:PAS domain S-box-containing protein